MDQLEKIMRENKELFMEQEPSEGHFNRFEKHLIQQNRKTKTISLAKRISRVAAIGLLAIMSSMWAYNEFLAPAELISLGDVNQEYQEVEFYFTSQINSKYQELQDNELLNDVDYQNTLSDEMTQMDSIYTHLQKELGSNPGDERIINAMIKLYQTKLQVITNILIQLESIQQQNNPINKNQNQYESVEL
ncbi:MAG: hypothetical protein HN936_02880 [Bacteroidetes bacterium]|jgi:hypothetical protein|nr:hypothetical protein [Bacteroidota bacterium]MBT4398333.1 hypothetical protein [Bacteroidota bacterium]MBT4409952.1 hypothetical protein [Bacteroidota bacterium]MBT5427450.1 hypothetical protein [Bacteroidota bacterium]MBT7092162.1 hypothetical protein [Bacteroidota bacterium]